MIHKSYSKGIGSEREWVIKAKHKVLEATLSIWLLIFCDIFILGVSFVYILTCPNCRLSSYWGLSFNMCFESWKADSFKIVVDLNQSFPRLCCLNVLHLSCFFLYFFFFVAELSLQTISFVPVFYMYMYLCVSVYFFIDLTARSNYFFCFLFHILITLINQYFVYFLKFKLYCCWFVFF